MKNQAVHKDPLSPHDVKFPRSNIWRPHRPHDLNRRRRSRKPYSAPALCELSLWPSQFILLLIGNSAAPTEYLIWFSQALEPFPHVGPSLRPFLLPEMWFPWLLARWLPLRLQVSIKVTSLPIPLTPESVSDSAPCIWVLFQGLTSNR